MFEIVRRDGLARIGKFTTKSGKTIETPALLPVVNPKIRTVPPRELYDTFGFPVELTQELAAEQGKKVDLKDFQDRFKAHQENSRMGADQQFKGGLADHAVGTTKLHTATHLLNAALRKIVSPDIQQKGSNITAERLRFDFNLDRKCTPEELKAVEQYVNDAIKAAIPVVCEEMPIEKARERGAIGVFGDKYGEIL